MKSKHIQPRLLYPTRLSFKIKGEIRSFLDKKKLNTKPVLQQMLKGLPEEGEGEEKKKKEREEEEEEE